MTSSTLYDARGANRTLPLVSRIVRDIVETHGRWRRLVDETEMLASTASPLLPDPRVATAERSIEALALEIAGYQRELADLGVELKDPATGLVDFPAVIDGRPAYLCWRLGEAAVEFWHERRAGFAGRRRITPAMAG